MERLLLAGFLIGHGWIHPAIYAMPRDPDKPAPFNPNRSWALAGVYMADPTARSLSVGLSWLTGAIFVLSGVLLLADSAAWMPTAVVGAVVGLALKGLYFNPWLIVGVLIDVGVFWAASASWPPSLV